MGRPAPLCRLSGHQPSHHLLRVTHDGSSVPVEELRQPGGGEGELRRPGGGEGELRLGLTEVGEGDGGWYTCTLIDHRTGDVVKRRVELKVDSGE